MVCYPAAWRRVIWPEASSGQNSIAAVSREGGTVCVVMRRLHSSWRRSMAFLARADFPQLGGRCVKANSASAASFKALGQRAAAQARPAQERLALRPDRLRGRSVDHVRIVG
jgi:hypothetical protein